LKGRLEREKIEKRGKSSRRNINKSKQEERKHVDLGYRRTLSGYTPGEGKLQKGVNDKVKRKVRY